MQNTQVLIRVDDSSDVFDFLQSIYAQGGRSFWIHNTGPVGCLPYVMDRLPITAGQVDKAGCASPFNEVAQYFNKKLKEAVGRLRMDLPLAALTYVDVYSLKYSLISHAHHYGILLFFFLMPIFIQWGQLKSGLLPLSDFVFSTYFVWPK